MNYRYYYDRIRINTVIATDDLKEMIDTEELMQYAHKIKIGEPYWMAKCHGYRGRIELYQATDKAIEVLQRYGLEKHGISRIEIARDKIYENSLITSKYRKMFQDSHYLRWGKGSFAIGTSRYMGKEIGKKRGMYVLCDLPPRGKFGDENIVHVEFVLIGRSSVKKKLKVETIYDLGKAEDYFRLLEDKYLVKAEINHKRVKKHYPEINIVSIGDLIDVVSKHKEQVRTKQYKHYLMNAICGTNLRKKLGLKKKFIIKKNEKLILNQSFSYFLKKR